MNGCATGFAVALFALTARNARNSQRSLATIRSAMKVAEPCLWGR
jgi:hypothetical protein